MGSRANQVPVQYVWAVGQPVLHPYQGSIPAPVMWTASAGEVPIGEWDQDTKCYSPTLRDYI